MYGSTGPPKKYSTPRGVADESSGARLCQKCSSTAHWTFECKDAARNNVRGTTTRLSRTQMLRWGIKQRRQEFVPEPTEKEAYTAQMRKVEQLLLAEAREEVLLHKRRRRETQDVKKEGICDTIKREETSESEE